MKFRFFIFFFLLFFTEDLLADDDIPRSLDPDLKIELFAEQPQIVTPTGLDVDHKGRVWAIESNTHFPPDGYNGHPTDRVLVMQDTTGDGKADKIVTFTDGLTHTMSVAVKPVWLDIRGQKSEISDQKKSVESNPKSAIRNPQSVFIATRRDIFLFHDDDGDLKADRKEQIIRLETEGNYPHNGLAGFAFDAMGWMYFGFGENLGADYKIIGSDGVTLSGGGEGGNLYRCRPDGTKLKQWATGFWNPHASCVDAFGRLFTVDNDPDSRPPCRLLHIIEGGDYGFRFRNGRKGLHPFTAWNGEIPGTLPMVSGTGEAPSGIVAYESDGLPKKYIGNLLVTSWGDHRIDRFVLEPKGASFQSRPETIVQGGENFRPVGLAVAPDGSLFCTDWVLKDYKLHGHGRVWRISMKNEPKRTVIDAATITSKTPIEELQKLLASSRLDVRRKAVLHLARLSFLPDDPATQALELAFIKTAPIKTRVEIWWDLSRNSISKMAVNSIEGLKFEANLFESIFDVFCGIVRSQRDGDLQCEFGRKCLLALAGNEAPEENVRKQLLSTTGWIPTLSKLNWDSHLDDPDYRKALDQLTQVNDPFHIASIATALGNAQSEKYLFKLLSDSNNKLQLIAALALRQRSPTNTKALRVVLNSPSSTVRRVAVQWVAEENLQELRPQVEAILNSDNVTTDLFLATLAALEMLDGKSPKDFDKTPPAKYVLPLVKDGKRSPAVRAQALRLVSPDDPALNEKLFGALLNTNYVQLKLETIRTLQHSSHKFAGKLMLAVAADENAPTELRAEAVTGLYGRWFAAENATEIMQTLTDLMQSDQEPLKLEAVRSARSLLVKTAKGRATRTALIKSLNSAIEKYPDVLQQNGIHRQIAEQLALAMSQSRIRLPDVLQPIATERPISNADWYKQALDTGGDAKAGRRVFFHADSGGCYKCHTVNGRGGNVGPDLSAIGRALNRKRLAESILEPSKEIAPQFTNWTFVMQDGKIQHGMILRDTRDGVQQIGTAEGTVVTLNAAEIELRQPQNTSVMPEKLVERMTVSEFRDLLAYLESLK